MSDTRFVIVGIVLLFAGFAIFGALAGEYRTTSIEMTQFENCFEYSNEKEPSPISCSYKLFDQLVFFITVGILIILGMILLIKGIKGRWDNNVKPEDMVGPGSNQNSENKEG